MFKSLLRFVAKLLIVVAIIFLLIWIGLTFSVLSASTFSSIAVPLGIKGVGGWLLYSIAGVVVGAIVDKDAAVDMARDIGTTLSAVGQSAGDAAGGVLAGVVTAVSKPVSALFSSLGGFVLAGLGLWYVYKSVNKESRDVSLTTTGDQPSLPQPLR